MSYLALPLRPPVPVGEITECPVCSKRLTVFAGSRLPCHALCLLNDDGKAVARSMLTTTKPIREIAAEMGVPASVIRAEYRARPSKPAPAPVKSKPAPVKPDGVVDVAIRDHACPKCGAQPGELCRRRKSGGTWRDIYPAHQAHKPRMDAARSSL